MPFLPDDKPDRFLTKWTKIRQMGRNKFILKHGILYWAIPTGIIYTLISNYTFGDNRLSDPKWILLNFATWGISGPIYGAIIWKIHERKFHRLTAPKPA